MKINGKVIEAVMIDEELNELAGDFGSPPEVVTLAAIRLLSRTDVAGFDGACEVEGVLAQLDKRSSLERARDAYMEACVEHDVRTRIKETPLRKVDLRGGK